MRGRWGRRGQSLLECALATVVLVTLLLAIIDFSYTLFVQQTLAAHVRDTARWAAVHPADADAVRRRVLDGPGGAGLYPALQPSNIVVETLRPPGEPPRIRVAIVGYRFRFLTPGLQHLAGPSEIAAETIPLESDP
jgi:hypothetical protein